MSARHGRDRGKKAPARPRQLAMRVELAIEGRPIAVRAEVPDGPTRPRRMLPLLRELGNAVVQIAVDAAAGRGETISCRAACGACCRQLVPITPAEAHDMRDLIGALPLERRRTVEARFEAARAKLVEAGLHDTLMHPETVSEDDKESVALRYFALGIPCPFLEAESCSIHPERPIACREYLVTSDPAHCAAPTADTIRMVPLAGEVSTAVARADGPSDGPAPWVPLIVAPEWSASNPDLQPPAPATELLQRVLDGLAG